MENKTTIQTVKGTIFDTERAEGIAVFIPAGLVGIRLDAERFASSFGVTNLHPKEMVVVLPAPFGPSKPTISPQRQFTFIPFTTVRSP